MVYYLPNQSLVMVGMPFSSQQIENVGQEKQKSPFPHRETGLSNWLLTVGE
jgi:hypothetical protein